MDKVSCRINNPSGNTTEKVIALQSDGTYCVSYVPFEEGPHTIDIRYDNVPVPGSPFSVNVQYRSDPSKCKAYGPGLEKGFVNKYNVFVVNTKGKKKKKEGTKETNSIDAIVRTRDHSIIHR